MPEVSIIVPVHNTEQYLEACVRSLTAQTLRDIEIILVENGSTDGSAALCAALARTDARIRHVTCPVADLSAARNFGVRASKGHYLGFVDSDDTVLPEMFEDMHSLAADNGLGLVDCNYCKVYDGGKRRYKFGQDGRRRILTAREAVELNFGERVSKLVCTMLFRRDLFEGGLQFPEHMFNEDRASTFLFMAAAGKVGIIDKAYYLYYQRGNSLSHTKDFRKYRDSLEADCRRLRFIIESGMFPGPAERRRAAFKTANALVRKLGHMYSCARTDAEKAELRALLSTTALIPPGTSLALKQRAILLYLRARLR